LAWLAAVFPVSRSRRVEHPIIPDGGDAHKTKAENGSYLLLSFINLMHEISFGNLITVSLAVTTN